MHLNEGVERFAQEPLVFSRGHAFERLEEQLLLLGGRWKHVVCLSVMKRVWLGGESWRGGRGDIIKAMYYYLIVIQSHALNKHTSACLRRRGLHVLDRVDVLAHLWR